MATQRAYFPMDTVALSQGYGKKSSTHKYSYALDLYGKDAGKDPVYAPFDCRVSKLYQPRDTKRHSPEVWLTSIHKVLCPNGYRGYLTISITHPDAIMKMKMGQRFKQGDRICFEGRLGGATGNHIHLEVSKGRRAGWQVVNGNYVNVNKVKPEEYLFVKENAKITDNTYKGDKYNFIKESDLTYTVTGVPVEPLNVHKTADYNASSIIPKAGLKNGEEVIRFYKKGSLAYTYHYEIMGYVADKFLKKN